MEQLNSLLSRIPPIVDQHWYAFALLLVLFLIIVSHLLIIRRLRIVDDKVKALVQHQREIETWMESVRNAVVDTLR